MRLEVSHPWHKNKCVRPRGHPGPCSPVSDELSEKQKQVAFDYAQGRLSTPLNYASLRMTVHLSNKRLRNAYRGLMGELFGIGQLDGGSGHSGRLAVVRRSLEMLSFQRVSAPELWHPKCYIRV